MAKLWIRFGCFLTGYNYDILRNCSEASRKAVKKYLSAILIVALLWAFIGYEFTKNYIHGGVYACLMVASVMAFVVVQIERQIILSIGRNSLAAWFRVVIGILMAVMGSLIIDQVIFRSDIESNNRVNIENKVNALIPLKTALINAEKLNLDSTINSKEAERKASIESIEKHPMIALPVSEVNYSVDTSTGERKQTDIKKSVTYAQNPDAALIPQIDAQLKDLIAKRTALENRTFNIRDSVQAEIQANVGFLDELDVLFSILLSSWRPFVVWGMVFLFFLSLELFVLANKYFGDTTNDYDSVILHQLHTRIDILNRLGERDESADKTIRRSRAA